MKSTEYKVKYVNGKEEYFYCVAGFQEAIIRAMNYAYDKAWNPEIDTITDEYGKSVKYIEVKCSVI